LSVSPNALTRSNFSKLVRWSSPSGGPAVASLCRSKLGPVAHGLGGSAEVRRAFILPHLERPGYHEFDWLARYSRHHVCKIPSCVGFHYHAPVHIREVHFREMDVLLRWDAGHEVEETGGAFASSFTGASEARRAVVLLTDGCMISSLWREGFRPFRWPLRTANERAAQPRQARP
jgi:hypothetical protein